MRIAVLGVDHRVRAKLLAALSLLPVDFLLARLGAEDRRLADACLDLADNLIWPVGDVIGENRHTDLFIDPTVAPPSLVAAAPAQAVAPAEPAPASLPSAPAGTQLSLMIIDEVSTKTAKSGDRFPLRLDRPVIIDGRVVIAEGAAAVGEVIAASESGIAGKAGRLATRLLHLTVAGRQLPISGDPRSAGQNGALAVVLASLALTPWGLFARGNNAKLKAGDIVVGVLVEPYTPVALPLTTTARTGPVVNP